MTQGVLKAMHKTIQSASNGIGNLIADSRQLFAASHQLSTQFPALSF
jgi:hypothetical protein